MVLDTSPSQSHSDHDHSDPPPQRDSNTGPLKILPDHIHKPNILTRTLCFLTQTNYLKRVNLRIAQRVENALVLTQRPPTQEEFNAMLEHCSRAVAHERIGVYIALTGWTVLLSSRIRKSPSFAKYVQTPITASRLYNGFATWHVAEPQTARVKTLTAGLKASFVGFAGLTASSSYAVYEEMEGTIHDPRLAGFLKQVKSQDREELQRRKNEVAEKRRRFGSASTTSVEEVGASPESAAVSVPEGEGQGQGYGQAEGQGSAYEGSETPQSEYQKRQARYTRKPPVEDKRTNTPTEQPSQGMDFFDDDDASPVAPEYKNASLQEVNSIRGNTWARIRAQSLSGGAAQGAQESTVVQPAAKNETWGSSGRPEFGRASEREQAQADFDRLLDSERSMGQDSSKKGWEKW